MQARERGSGGLRVPEDVSVVGFDVTPPQESVTDLDIPGLIHTGRSDSLLVVLNPMAELVLVRTIPAKGVGVAGFPGCACRSAATRTNWDTDSPRSAAARRTRSSSSGAKRTEIIAASLRFAGFLAARGSPHSAGSSLCAW